MIWIDSNTESYRPNEVTCLSLAALLHAVFLFWNPVLFPSIWKTITAPGNGGIIIVDVPGTQTSILPRLTRGLPTEPPAPSTPRPVIEPFIHKHFYQAIPAVMPLQPEQNLLADARTAIPIAPIKGDGSISRPPSLISRTVPGIPHLVGRTSLPQDLSGSMEAGGHFIIQLNGASKAETVTTPVQRSNLQKGPPIEGPLSNRPVIHRVIPAYPTWAEEQGIIGTTKLYFTVTPEGVVRPDIRVEYTSGHPELDQLATEALRQWRFAPAVSSDGPQWGVITFFFFAGAWMMNLELFAETGVEPNAIKISHRRTQ